MMHKARSRAVSVFFGLIVRGGLAGGLAVGAVAAGIVLTGPEASAKTGFDSAYGFDRTWNAALRMVRVDLDMKVVEKDEQSGYFLFEYKAQSSSKPAPGSFELVRGRGDDEPVHVVVQLSQSPRYHEQVLVDGLARKLRNEYGDPPRRKPTTPAPVDAGAPEGGTN